MRNSARYVMNICAAYKESVVTLQVLQREYSATNAHILVCCGPEHMGIGPFEESQGLAEATYQR